MSWWRLGVGLLIVVGLATSGCGAPPRTQSQPVTRNATPATCGTSGAAVTRRVALERGAGAVTIGEGGVWVGNVLRGSVTGVDARSGRILRRFANIRTPVDLVAGSGRVWVAARDADSVVALDPSSGRRRRAAEVDVPVAVQLVGRELWMLSLDDGSLYAIDSTSRSQTVSDLGLPLDTPVAMATLGSDLWVLGQGDRSVIGVSTGLRRITAQGVRIVANAVTDTVAGDAAVWVADPTDSSVLRITPGTDVVQPLHAPAGVRPATLAIGRCGLWAADSGGVIARFDTATLKPVGAPLRIGRSAGGIADDGAGGVWVTDPDAGSVLHVRAR